MAIVLGYFGRWIPADEIRSACGVSRDGSRATYICQAAQFYGLNTKAFRAEPQDLRRFSPPMILHWNFNHFVVFEGFDNGKVFLNDPASGPRIVNETELDESFTGVVLVCQPGPKFVREGNRPSFAQTLASQLKGNWAPIIFVVVCGLALMIPSLIVPFFSNAFVSEVLLREMREWLTPLIFWMGAAAAFSGLLTLLQRTCLSRLETWITLRHSSRLFWHILRLPVTFFNQRFLGEITSRLTLTSRVAEILSHSLAINFLDVSLVVIFGTLMLCYNPVLTGICMSFLLLEVGVLYFFSRRRFDDYRRLFREEGQLQGAIMGGLEMIETIKATGAEADLMARWTGYQAKIINIEQKIGRPTAWLQSVAPLAATLNCATVLVIGSTQVLNGTVSLGEFVAYQLLLATFIAPVSRLLAMGTKLQILKGDLNRLDDLAHCSAELPSNASETLPTMDGLKLTGTVELRHVSFGYNRLEPPLIKDFNLRLRPGDRVALVGASGSGKSTVAKLVAGLLTPWDGEIYFDGRPRSKWARIILTNSIAVVDETIDLFESTVRDNITLWDPSVPPEEISAAAKSAAIHEEIMARPQGYEDLIEERGRNWSGGQRQQLDIARALVGQPSILILDEATSALDPQLELQIDGHLRRLGCTCLIIAHRLSTIRDADEILVLDRGTVVERGTHEELIAHDGVYRRLAFLA